MGKAHATGFYSLLLRFFAVGRILESDIFQQRFFGNDRRFKCFCWIRVSDLHLYFWIPAYAGMTAEVSAKLVVLVFRRLFFPSMYIVAWALPRVMTKRGRLKF